MKILSLRAENIKKLVAVEIKPGGNLVQITGRNGAGKTSILDSIWWALGGAGNIQAAPIRNGEHQARIRLDMGEIVVTRSFKPGKDGDIVSSIVVENADGARFTSPQVMLDGLMGKLSFDPLEFARMAPREQFDVAKTFVPGVDFEKMEADNKADLDQRKELTRKAKELKTLAANITYPLGTPDVPVDQSALVGQMEEAAKTNSDLQTRKGNRAAAQVKINTSREKAEDLQKQVEDLKKQIDALLAEKEILWKDAAELEKKLAAAPALPEPVDVSDLRKQIDEAQKTNEAVALKQKRAAYDSDAKEFEEAAEKITRAIENREEKKRSMIAEAKLPVQGLEFGDGMIMMKGVPFDQASDAEKLKVSVAIAMALNPKVRVIRVRDGSLLDEESMKMIAQMADEKDYQVWIECVDSSGKVGFVIENGQLKDAEEKPKVTVQTKPAPVKAKAQELEL